MQTSAFERIDILAIAIGAMVTGVFFAVSGVTSAASALAGCMLGVLNFAALRFILSRMLTNMNNDRSSASLGLLFLFKLLGLMGVIYLLAQAANGLDGLAFAIGFTSILISVTTAGIVWKSGLLSVSDVSSNNSSSGEKAIQS